MEKNLKNQNKFVRVTMPDGSKYDIPASEIASNRADYYGKVDSKSKYQVVYDEEFKLAMEDDSELKDWLENNMNWEDVRNQATKVVERPLLSPEDFQEGIINGDKEIILD